MQFRTDLALEAREYITHAPMPGISSEERSAGNVTVNTIRITSEDASQKMQKPKGDYITVTVPSFCATVTADDEAVSVLVEELATLLPGHKGLTLVVGLGNREITPDALGPKVIDGMLATRHIQGAAAAAAGLDTLTPVSAIAPGVLGQTGMETSEIVASLVQSTKPDLVIVIDALAAQSPDRLGCTIQLSNTGISPGSGVLNRRKELSKTTLGVPVISMGVPTVVDSTTLIHGMLEESGGNTAGLLSDTTPMMVTPRDIDTLIDRAAKVMALAINSVLQPDISREDLIYLTA